MGLIFLAAAITVAVIFSLVVGLELIATVCLVMGISVVCLVLAERA